MSSEKKDAFINALTPMDVEKICYDLFPKGKKYGSDFTIGDLRGNSGKSLKVCLRQDKLGLWADFSSGDSGNIIDLYLLATGQDFKDGFPSMVAKYCPEILEQKKHKPKDVTSITDELHVGYGQIQQHFLDFISQNQPKEANYKITDISYYMLDENSWQYAIIRFDSVTEKYKKQIVPATIWRKNDTGKFVTKAKAVPTKRVIYNLPMLKHYPAETPVLIVAGEKCVKAATDIALKSERANGTLQIIPTTWSGGEAAIYKSDWSPLAERRGDIYLWPDNDETGISAMQNLCNEIRKENQTSGIFFILDKNRPKGFDIADLVCQKESVVSFIKENLHKEHEFMGSHVIKPTMKEDAITAGGNLHPATNPSNHVEPYSVGERLVCLGYADGMRTAYFYRSDIDEQIQVSTASLSTLPAILRVMSAEFWRRTVGETRSGSINITAATELLFTMIKEAGLYTPSKVKGFGVHKIYGAIIDNTHAESLIVDGEPHAFGNNQYGLFVKSARHLKRMPCDAWTQRDLESFKNNVNLLYWESPIFANYFLGWIFIAPICGSLRWRPHIWINGASLSGKSTALKFATIFLGDIGVKYEYNKATLAGVRRDIMCDAVPVFFDEFEADTPAAMGKANAFIELARSASDSDNGKGVQGSTEGDGVLQFESKTMVCFSSIGFHIKKEQDLNRITRLSLTRPFMINQDIAVAVQTKIESYLASIDNPEKRRSALLASINNAQYTLENIDVFRETSARVPSLIVNRRQADQMCALIAGYYSMLNLGKVAHPEEAIEFMNNNLDLILTPAVYDQDMFNFFYTLLSTLLQIRVTSTGRIIEVPIADAISVAAGQIPPTQDDGLRLYKAEIVSALRASGILVRPNQKSGDVFAIDAFNARLCTTLTRAGLPVREDAVAAIKRTRYYHADGKVNMPDAGRSYGSALAKPALARSVYVVKWSVIDDYYSNSLFQETVDGAENENHDWANPEFQEVNLLN